MKIFEIILKESPSEEDFTKLNINFINYLHVGIFFTQLHMFFTNPFAYVTQEHAKEKEMFVVKVELKKVRKEKKLVVNLSILCLENV